jgi:hypothetical protein
MGLRVATASMQCCRNILLWGLDRNALIVRGVQTIMKECNGCRRNEIRMRRRKKERNDALATCVARLRGRALQKMVGAPRIVVAVAVSNAEQNES